jgi:hypothetical protein
MAQITEAYKEGIINRIKKRPITTTLVVGGLAYLIYTKLSTKVKEVIDTKQQTKADTSGGATSNVSPWNWSAFNNYWLTRFPKGYMIFTSDSAKTICQNIYDSMGYFSDNDDVIKAQIKKCNSKVKVAQVAQRFSQMYSRDLFTFLKEGVGVRWNSGLDEANLNAIVDYVNSLPNYTK